LNCYHGSLVYVRYKNVSIKGKYYFIVAYVHFCFITNLNLYRILRTYMIHSLCGWKQKLIYQTNATDSLFVPQIIKFLRICWRPLWGSYAFTSVIKTSLVGVYCQTQQHVKCWWEHTTSATCFGSYCSHLQALRKRSNTDHCTWV
jgi:hypothetical protein